MPQNHQYQIDSRTSPRRYHRRTLHRRPKLRALHPGNPILERPIPQARSRNTLRRVHAVPSSLKSSFSHRRRDLSPLLRKHGSTEGHWIDAHVPNPNGQIAYVTIKTPYLVAFSKSEYISLLLQRSLQTCVTIPARYG